MKGDERRTKNEDRNERTQRGRKKRKHNEKERRSKGLEIFQKWGKRKRKAEESLQERRKNEANKTVE